jgi:hypothetical protein
MMRAMRILMFSVVVLVLAHVAGAAEAPPAPATLVKTRHFRVTGPDAGVNSVIASYAESALAHCSQLTGLPVRYDRFPPFHIEIFSDTNQPEQRVTRSQRLSEGILDQRVRVLNPVRADTEDFLEALCWLVLNRLAVQQQTRLVMPAPPQAPEWLAVGLAQNLFPQYAQRNRQVALQRWRAGRATRLAEVTTWRLLPEGRWADKALCGEAVEFLLATPERTALLAALLERAMAGRDLSADWLAQQLGAKDVRALEKQWDLWVLHWEDAVPNFGALTRQNTDTLREMLHVDPTTYGFTALPVSVRLTPQAFITRRKEPVVRRLAEQVGQAVLSSGLGRPPEYQPMLGAWGAFFDAVADVRPPGWRRLFHRTPNEKQVRALLVAAESQLAALEQTLDQRRDYMVEFEQKQRQGRSAAPASTNAPAR